MRLSGVVIRQRKTSYSWVCGGTANVIARVLIHVAASLFNDALKKIGNLYIIWT
jgi:hypothetical protein